MPDFFIHMVLFSMLLGLHFMLALGGFGVVFMAAMAETFSRTGQKAFMNKLSDQSCKLGVWLMLYLGLALAGGMWIAIVYFPQQAFYWTIDKGLLMVVLGVPGTAVLFGILYKWLQKPLSKARGLHAAIGLAASLAALATLLLAAMAKQHQLMLAGKEKTFPTLKGMLQQQVASPETWGYFGIIAMLTLASGGALTLLFLLLRREKDDYGRDYYAYAARFASKWTFVFALLTLAPWGFQISAMWPGIQVMPQNQFAVGLLAAFPVLMLTTATLFFAVGRSAMPMRHKPAMITGAVCIWLALGSFTAFVNQVYWIFPKMGLFGV